MDSVNNVVTSDPSQENKKECEPEHNSQPGAKCQLHQQPGEPYPFYEHRAVP